MNEFFLFVPRFLFTEFSKESKSAATDLISFSATSSYVSPYSGSNVTYEIVKVNNGNGLDAETGVFTVSKTGKYKFTFYANYAVREAWNIPLVFMKKNGMILEVIFVSDHKNNYELLFMSTVQFLYTNDKIWIYFSDWPLKNVEFSGILE